MNLIFTIILLFSIILISLANPNSVLKAMTDGASKSVTLGINLIAIYAVWSGFLQVAEDSGLCNKIADLLKPIIKKIFKPKNKSTEGNIAINLSANLLGMGGVATPSGIEAVKLLYEEKNYDGANILLIIASTSIQIIPTTVISLKQSFNSLSPFDIFVPSLICTVISTVLGISLYILTKKRAKK